MSFEIKLQHFEGPFDLLLFFIEREELDIYDIPITKITNDFMDYLQQLEKLNIEIASEFIVVAATLMSIKAKMLLPKDETKTDAEDPRADLVNALLEYQKYKSVIPAFEALELQQMQQEKRGNLTQEMELIAEKFEVDIEMHRLDLFRLLKVYEQVLLRQDQRQLKANAVHTIVPYAHTIEGQKKIILLALESRPKISFLDILTENPTKIIVIFNFLAILELLQNEIIMIEIEEGYNNFSIKITDKIMI
ncbi:MAG: chromosome segregation protein ScpA [Bacteroidetes bacterium]|nr:MAG: chromosome segregation protein ScpA [Bacteroidota bacterium]TAG88124.1 MAG: chromosome segregation protein ScpA [Bacteroidota bacterium]